MDDELYELVKTDPERAWPALLSYVNEHPEAAPAQGMIEEWV